MTERPIVLPDLGDELTSTLARIEEAILDDHLDAFHRLAKAARPTQTPETTTRPGRMFGPDGRYEHVALRVAVIDDADVAAMDGVEDDVPGLRRFCELLREAPSPCDHDLETAILRLTLGEDRVLTVAEECSYQRTADVLNRAWQGSVLDRWTY